MDFDEVENEALHVLQTATRFGSPVDRPTLLNVAHGNDPDWRADPRALRRAHRAMELLVRSGYLSPVADGSAVQVTTLGRERIQLWQPLRETLTWISGWIEEEELREALDSTQSISANTFSRLQIGAWRQFSNIDLDFHSPLTILTGANAAGKTTVLNLLAPHFNWSAQLLVRNSGGQHSDVDGVIPVGTLAYTNGVTSELLQQPGSGTRNSPIAMSTQQPVPGIFINSHRSISSYQPLSALPPRFSETELLLQQFSSEIQTRFSGSSSQYSPLYRMKEALFAAAVYAYGNQSVRADLTAQAVWEGYQEVLRHFLPMSFGFEKLLVDDAEIIIKTQSAEFPIEAISGGLSAMLELSWQIYLRSRNQPSFTVCIDEPENHLHPELQRSIMPALLTAFPDVNFIVATHSPFVVTSSREANVYAFSRGAAEDAITSRLIDDANFSATADETLSSVLGLDNTVPLWAEHEIAVLLASLNDNPTAPELRQLREGLENLGLDRQFPAAVRSISSERQDD